MRLRACLDLLFSLNSFILGKGRLFGKLRLRGSTIKKILCMSAESFDFRQMETGVLLITMNVGARLAP